MNFTRELREEAGEFFELPAMVDMVFILLSFFVMATQLRLNELDLAMRYRSQAAGTGSIAQDLPKSIPIELRKTAGGVGITVGRARLPDNDYEALRQKLIEINLPDVEISLAADPALTVDQVARGLDGVLASPMKRVALCRLTIAGGKDAQP